MTVSLNNYLLNYLLQIENSNSATTASTSSTDTKELSSEFAQLLASSLMNDSSSQMLGTLSSSNSELTDGDSNNSSSISGISDTSTQITNSVEDLLWNLLSSAANNSTDATTAASGASV
ncbi:MAG: hypothetical protein ABF629_02155 [Sporolactobacillus sp.]